MLNYQRVPVQLGRGHSPQATGWPPIAGTRPHSIPNRTPESSLCLTRAPKVWSFSKNSRACARLEAARRLSPTTETLDGHPALATCLICIQLWLVSLVHEKKQDLRCAILIIFCILARVLTSLYAEYITEARFWCPGSPAMILDIFSNMSPVRPSTAPITPLVQ